VLIQDAVIRNIEIVGEATKKISKQFTQSHPEIPWQDMAGNSSPKITQIYPHVTTKGQDRIKSPIDHLEPYKLHKMIRNILDLFIFGERIGQTFYIGMLTAMRLVRR